LVKTKKGFVENLKKNQFSGVGWTVRVLGADGPRVFDIYLISEVFDKSFLEKYASRRIVCGPYADGPLFTSKPNRIACSSVDRRTVRRLPADSPRGSRGQSAGSWWTFRPAQRPLLPAVDFAFFIVGIQTRTVREGIADNPRGTCFSHNG
jgi:hypothetical protein